MILQILNISLWVELECGSHHVHPVLSWYLLCKPGKYFPNEIMEVHVAAEQHKDKVRIWDQLENQIKRLKVNKVGCQTVLKTYLFHGYEHCVCSWGLQMPAAIWDSYPHTYTHTNIQTHILILQHIELGMCSNLVLCIYSYTDRRQSQMHQTEILAEVDIRLNLSLH